MNQDQLFRRYQDFQTYIGWVAVDEDQVRTVARVLEPHLGPLIEDFYAELDRHAELRKVIEGSHTTIEGLKGTFLQWLKELLSGPHDKDYVARRWQIGRRHLQVGLEQVYVSMAMARLRSGLVETLDRFWHDVRGSLMPAARSLNKLLDLDLMIIENAYQTEYLARIHRNEQLAKVGVVAGSVGHELREPLNVLKTSVYYLRNAQVPRPEKTAEHFQRIERHMGEAEQILTELSDFARMPAPQMCAFSVGACVNEALEQDPLPDNIRLIRDFPLSLPQALGDKDQIRTVFVRLNRRARDGMPDGGKLSIRGNHAADAVEVVFQDTGLPMSQATLAAIRAPLSGSNVRTQGMGLAVVRAILDVNAGDLHAVSEPARGSTMTIRLASAHPG